MNHDHARMPPGIPYIVANEFAERFCYYGLNAILSVYMVNVLRFGEAQATTWQSLFKSGAYFFPLLGAIVSDVLLGKYRTILLFSLSYVGGCALLALGSTSPATLAAGLFFIALGTGGIKPCVSTNLGDQFTRANAHLIERAFSWFYLSINAGSLISIAACPWLLREHGPRLAFGLPGAMMSLAVLVFWLGRKRFAVLPPAGKPWLRELFCADGLKLIGRLLLIYLFIAFFWSLWEQSNGQTWTLQAQSDLMDKHLGFGLQILPAQIQIANALFILLLVPLFSYGVYPLWARFAAVTPLRKIGAGMFVTASSFVLVAWIENRIQHGQVVSVWWQILAYAILTASEVLVSITALEFSYKQAPLKIKSFIMALFLLSQSLGNLFTGLVNDAMVRPLAVHDIRVGAQTWVALAEISPFTLGQKLDFAGDTGIRVQTGNGAARPLAGTYLIAEIDAAQQRLRVVDAIHRQDLMSQGAYRASAKVSTYALVGPAYFLFFAGVMAVGALLFIVVAMFYRERVYVREAAG
ncbi:proton-dependent oligopeptide transporter, POT family [Solimonas aquatica]|uniref:Proton-dependent oligopeptide transporter, POT family n=1 Tax=Solimonas aquatica TaxID=489703 RepID=A0A1H9KV83_9GAMM|nr:MFS transporter [Solimonas aquatica]SER02968.1 proton-dependent oligopeptide transporter, POT family [Solimonas aquatica]